MISLSAAPAGNPVWNESLQLPCSAPPSDIITIIFWGTPEGNASARRGASKETETDKVFLGHVAVPSQRVAQSGREEGWYDLRDTNGEIVHSGGGAAAAALVSLSFTSVVPSLPSHVQGFLVSASVDDDDSLEKRYHVLDPYLQRLVTYSRLPLPGMSQGAVYRCICFSPA